MLKTYRYRNLSFAVANETEVNFSVEFISNGNMGVTIIDVPRPKDIEIENSGTKLIGLGRNLRGQNTRCVTRVENLVPEEDEIRIQYKINGQLLIEHSNPKSETDRALICLYIKFPVL